MKEQIKQDSFNKGIDITEEEYNSKIKDHENQYNDSELIKRSKEYFKEKGYTINDLWFDNNYNIMRFGPIKIYTYNRNDNTK